MIVPTADLLTETGKSILFEAGTRGRDPNWCTAGARTDAPRSRVRCRVRARSGRALTAYPLRNRTSSSAATKADACLIKRKKPLRGERLLNSLSWRGFPRPAGRQPPRWIATSRSEGDQSTGTNVVEVIVVDGRVVIILEVAILDPQRHGGSVDFLHDTETPDVQIR